MFNDLVDKDELYRECIKYYANILTPFSKFVDNKIKEVLDMKIPIDLIATSHGVIWRDNPIQIVQQYIEWAKDYKENQITILYDTMWEGTRIMAEKIAEGIHDADKDTKILLLNTAKGDKNDIITEVFKSKAILVGSPTINKGILSSIAEIIEIIKGLQFKGKKYASFGCYGWSGESIKVLNKNLDAAGFERINDGIKAMWNPDESSLAECFLFGREFANSLINN
jgi:flavorubredoxin